MLWSTGSRLAAALRILLHCTMYSGSGVPIRTSGTGNAKNGGRGCCRGLLHARGLLFLQVCLRFEFVFGGAEKAVTKPGAFSTSHRPSGLCVCVWRVGPLSSQDIVTGPQAASPTHPIAHPRCCADIFVRHSDRDSAADARPPHTTAPPRRPENAARQLSQHEPAAGASRGMSTRPHRIRPCHRPELEL